MNYGQFLNMIPEFYLVCILLVVFFGDFFLHRREDKHNILFGMTVGLMAVLPVRIAFLSEPAEAYGQCHEGNPERRYGYCTDYG